MIPPDLQNIISFMTACPIRWAICGGWAIDLFVGKTTRTHKDIDIALLRRDQQIMHQYLSQRGWRLDIAAKGQLTPWKAGENIHLPRHIVFCKHPDFEPDFLELLLNEASDTHFQFRRNPAIQLELERAFITSASGVPILAPEIALLYKSKRIHVEGNTADFQNAIAHMGIAQRQWLAQALRIEYGSHDWLTAIEHQNDTF
jgi:hypothetical protein